jgi:hypothetical protein
VRRHRHRLLTLGALVGTSAILGAGFPAKTVSPEKWARSVCSALTDWGGELETASESFSEAESRREATGALGDAIDATETVIKDLRKAGTPDVDGGKATAKAFIAPFRDAKTLLEDGVEQAGDLPSDPDEFEERLTEIDDELGDGFRTVGEDIEDAQLDADRELQTVLEEEPDCADIFGDDSGASEPESTDPDEETDRDLP